MVYNFLFKEQIKNKGCFASIDFEINFVESAENELKIEYYADSCWEIISKSAALIFYDYFTKNYPLGHLRIKIIDIDYLPVDSNNLIIFYSVIKGLINAFDIEIDLLAFNKENELFTFPEIRSI